ncbi:RrF2 family transcriptional regulator [Pedobacter heparinus]|uniref:Transcriptional regulator, Rrf2 family n=1 Tax=Pedobacter heparinus (strain ATCC 13125 / DSM 2366 / CIP 104194 / JCM 7457 / NBRC 12017 / NCIMB 9290 / NRRL B-14731 / HIM 762-3) TaxID=485917 RepID=C6Y2M2_PEDHD|nr:Rrf2 family transcriptional regulator [Pedobacter heparinus]ACU05232.1 transcriptional regulator, Rrf2 family [Pedobacter heparinus DSM 2366]
MKITAQEEYGLRILLRIGRHDHGDGISIPAISEAEGLSGAYVAKLTRILRMAGYINSTPGNKGGYVLAQTAGQININQVMKVLGGALYSKKFCEDYPGTLKLCTNSIDCSIRSLWQMIQFTVDQLLDKVTLQDLISQEQESSLLLESILQQHVTS